LRTCSKLFRLFVDAIVSDPYFKLKPRDPTPVAECCCCSQLIAVYLAHKLSDNPIYCATCRGEVAPERIGFDDTTTESIAGWNRVYGAVYTLWLDSGGYEAWAQAELQSKESEINRAGLQAREALARYIPTSYLWFWNEARPPACPLCESSHLMSRGQLLVCENCSVSI
jgi:hypothetical protein